MGSPNAPASAISQPPRSGSAALESTLSGPYYDEPRRTHQAVLEELMRKSLVTAALAVLVGLAGAPLRATTAAVGGSPSASGGADLSGPRKTINVDRIAAEKAGVSLDVLQLATDAVSCGVASGDLQAPPTLTLIDYSLPSTRQRLWVFDLHT